MLSSKEYQLSEKQIFVDCSEAEEQARMLWAEGISSKEEMDEKIRHARDQMKRRLDELEKQKPEGLGL